jgi:hypothetical protein
MRIFQLLFPAGGTIFASHAVAEDWKLVKDENTILAGAFNDSVALFAIKESGSGEPLHWKWLPCGKPMG